jgi:hypothetical protein
MITAFMTSTTLECLSKDNDNKFKQYSIEIQKIINNEMIKHNKY